MTTHQELQCHQTPLGNGLLTYRGSWACRRHPSPPSWHGSEDDVTPFHPLRPTACRTSRQRVRTEKQSQRCEARSAAQLGPVRGRRKSSWLAVTQHHRQRLHTPTPTTCILPERAAPLGPDLDGVWAQPPSCVAGKGTGKAPADSGANPRSAVSTGEAGRSWARWVQGKTCKGDSSCHTQLTAGPSIPTQSRARECLWAKLHPEALPGTVLKGNSDRSSWKCQQRDRRDSWHSWKIHEDDFQHHLHMWRGRMNFPSWCLYQHI